MPTINAVTNAGTQTYTSLCPFGGFESADAWSGGTAESSIVYSGALSRRLAKSPASQSNTFKAYPTIVPPLDLSMAHRFTIQTRLENGSPGFWQANLNLLLRDDVTFNTYTVQWPLAFNYQTNQGIWVKRSVNVSWGIDPTRIVELVFSLNIPASPGFNGGLAYIDDWRMEHDRDGCSLVSLASRV